MPSPKDVRASEEATLAAEPLPSDAETLIGPAAGEPTARPSGRVTQLLRGELGLTRLGHYVLLHKLGEGGMGVVFAAYDETLDRKVAIKLLRAEGRAHADTRLIREAQAMARLSHPNVTQIYEIGQREDLTFIVMEFIDGVTLRDWLAARARSRAEILAVFGAAGRGLAAAHAKGLVHRDFKPENVMIRADGRVVVMDFGLAREGGPIVEDAAAAREAAAAGAPGSATATTTDAPLDELRTGRSELSIDLTATGALLGTPAYMAPEQFKGEPTDALTDQFSFSVALWEALHGRRPFAAVTLAELSLAVVQGDISESARRGDVPSWLDRVLARGIAVEPGARWPSMAALLDALAADPTRRRRLVLAGLTLAAIVAGAVLGSRVLADRARDRTLQACAAEARAIESVWSDAVAGEFAARFAGTDRIGAWAHARSWIDMYARDWAALRERACVETRIEGSHDRAWENRVAACLDDGRAAAAALVEVWTTAEDRIVANAATAAAGLPPIAPCTDDAWLAQRVEPPADQATRDQVASLRARLGRAEALQLVGEFEAGKREAAAVVEAADALAWTPLAAEARLLLAMLDSDLGDGVSARDTLERAGLDALGAGHDLVALRAAIALTSIAGYQLSDHDAGRYWAALATNLLARMNLEASVHEAALRSSVGDLEWSVGEFAASLASYQAALEIYEAALGPEHPEVARQLDNIGYLHMEQGHYDEAIRHDHRALELYEAALGPTHPRVGEALTFLGDALRQRGDYDEAIATLHRALAVFEAALGPDHPQVGDTLNNLGSSLSHLGRDDEALAAFARALSIYEAAYGPDSSAVATSLNNVATIHGKRGEYDEAVALLRRALALWAASRGPDHPNVGVAHSNLGSLLITAGRPAEALPEFEQALAIFEAAFGAEHPKVAHALYGVGQSHAALDQLDEARATLERAVAMLEAAAVGPSPLARPRFELARVLDRLGERERAIEIAKLAGAGFVAEGEGGAELLASVDAWLAARER